MKKDYIIWFINPRGRPVQRPSSESDDLIKNGWKVWSGTIPPKETYYPNMDSEFKSDTQSPSENIQISDEKLDVIQI